MRHGFVADLRRLKKAEWFYNNAWREPDFVRLHILPKVRYVIAIAKKKGGRVLELGCGNGFLSLELARNGLHVVGIDGSRKNIEIAQKLLKANPFVKGFGSLEYMCADIEALDLGTDCFSSVVFFSALHHMSDVDALLRKVHRALKNTGRLLYTNP